MFKTRLISGIMLLAIAITVITLGENVLFGSSCHLISRYDRVV